ARRCADKGQSVDLSDQTTESGIPNFIGTWHYETITQAVLGTASDTILYDYVNNPHEQQFYEVYTPDSIMTFYVIQNDTLMNKLRFSVADKGKHAIPHSSV
ncbi:hypothetical protein PZH42_29310, partial [Bacteroides cellulosilyticus]|nr:hypothetical protein [Bacteroides cellulosilyticus]